MSGTSTPVKCTRCRHACDLSDWLNVPHKKFSGCTEKACPRCGCKSYYDMTPQVAWCWATGLIEIGDSLPPDGPDGGGAIEIARGPRCALEARLAVAARHGQGASRFKLLVPGVPEAEGQEAKGDALAEWLAWCRKSKRSDGVTFSHMT